MSQPPADGQESEVRTPAIGFADHRGQLSPFTNDDT